MKKQLTTLFLIAFTLLTYAQESTSTYQKALDIITNNPDFKRLDIQEYTLSKQSISFINSAYAFYLDEPNRSFIEYDFENHFGELYQPIEIKEFESLRKRKRAKHILYVSETEQAHFIVELFSFKRKKRGKYPKFYSGTSYSFLFKKETHGGVKYLRMIKVSNQ